jgi:TolB-like protein/Tfp pilus assembly protein PilF
MKRCPECGRDYNDDSLSFCLDDGSELLFGPGSGSGSVDEPQTAIFHDTASPEEVATRAYSGVTQEGTTPDSESSTSDARWAPTRKIVITAAIAAAILAALGLGIYRAYAPGAEKQIESVAVMPFVNEGGNPEIEYLSDGMTEALISSLSQVPNLNVKARSSVFRYKGKGTDIPTIGRDLKVQAVLNGRIVQRGGDVALYLELIDAATENVLFKADYLRPLSNLVALQSEIARDVSNRLRAKLTPVEKQEVEKSYTQNAEAYRLYLQGRFHWNKRTPEEHRKAISYFEQAVALDPTYALAYAGLADCYAVESSPAKGDERIRLVRSMAEKAIELDPKLGQPHAALANYHWEKYDWDAAEREFRTAIELDPNYPTARQWYGEFLSRLGRHDEAITELKKAAELDPVSLIIASDLIYVLANARRYDEALEQADRTLAMDPDWRPALSLKSFVYEVAGDLEAAITSREATIDRLDFPQARKEAIRSELAELRKVLKSSGPEAYWRKELEFELGDRSRPGEFSPFYIAEIYSMLNEKDKAFEWLNRAIDTKEDSIDLAKVTPSLDNLRSDARWAPTLARLNLTP